MVKSTSAYSYCYCSKSPGWVFKPDGAVSVNHNLGMLSWHFGPEGSEPVVKGKDIAIVEYEKVKTLYVMM